jgi:CRP/FNR family transcriptional regulator, dissimilatory nitrate respiration regulator
MQGHPIGRPQGSDKFPTRKSVRMFTIEMLPTTIQSEVIWQDVPVGQIIFQDGSVADLLFFLVTGQVRLLHYTDAGQSVMHYRVETGEFFAEVVLFQDIYTCSAIADQPSRVAAIPKVAFATELSQNPELAMTLMALMSRRLHFTKIMLELRSIRSARERLLRYLQIMIPLMGSGESSLELDRPFRAVAEELGLSAEVFSRTLKVLQEEGLIERTQRRIVLL